MDRIMEASMGGEVKEFLQKWGLQTILCFGTCRKERVMNEFKGYEHDGGLADASGKRWWVFFECPKCKYGHSFAKMKFFAEHTEIERKVK